LTEIQKQNLVCSRLSLRSLFDVLKRQVLTKDQTVQVIADALRLQLGHYQERFAEPSAGAKSIAGAEDDSEQVEKESGVVMLHPWALDIALASICKHTPHLGKLMTRTREDALSSLQLDKYEKNLVANMIMPQDIGVSYSMIGGLDDVKQLLKQCISYPLKYPRLYSQGLAQEAVKGLLLFGPPGTGK
jgi:SpoVK/Ycf46/Vps4 family AAA+-type ATPase